jgi:arylsulfatase A-like enzyme
MTRRIVTMFVAAAMLALPALLFVQSAKDAAAATKAGRPNIIVILADDLGYADLGAQGLSSDVKTPNIDSLAANGVRFTSGYVSCPVCSPTRAGLMTGRYQERFGHELNPPPPPDKGSGLPREQILLPEVLKRAGYATAIVGKWHLGMLPGYRPWERGFDEQFGFFHALHDYFDLSEKGGRNYDAVTQWPAPPNTHSPAGEAARVPDGGYLTDLFSREAVSFIARHKDRAFFLYLPFNAVHAPLQAPKHYLDQFAGVSDEKRRLMLAMLKAMDNAVGAVLAELRRHALEENTLIFFVSDNGGPTAGNGSKNGPLSGFKGEVLEGGVRVPFLVQWKARVPAGKVSDLPVIQLDIFATAVKAAGGEMPRDRVMDGVDLVPYLTGQSHGQPHEYLFWRFGAQHAIRKGNWKLSITPRHGTILADLSTDLSERHDLSREQPRVLADLEAALAKWEKELVAPLFGLPNTNAPESKTTEPASVPTRPVSPGK